MNIKQKISAVIFDCDGVMFDSRQANINFYNTLLSHFGLPPMTEKDFSFIHMHTVHESVRYLFRNTSYEEAAHAYRMQIGYGSFLKDMVIEPGLKELLTFLRPGYGLAVATNRTNTIDEVLELNGLSHFFDIVVSSLDVKSPKPHPESVFKILDFFGIGPDECWYVGDSEVDRETCERAGVPLVAYRNRNLSAAVHIESLLEIKDILEKRALI